MHDRWWNDRLTEWFAGWALGATLDGGYRDWHFHHHRMIGTPQDPELAYRGPGSSYELPISRSKIWQRFVADLFGLGTPGLLAFIHEIVPERRIRYIPPIAAYAGLVAVTWSLDAIWISALWIFSIVAGFWAVFRMRTWFEHVGLEAAGRYGSHRFSVTAIERILFFPHNTWCHFEHHLYPQVPYFNLPRLRERLLEYGANESRCVVPFGKVLARFHELDGTGRSPALSPED